jgi:hypothetical protein
MKTGITILGILLHGFFLVAVSLFSLAIALAMLQITSLPPNKLIQSGIALSVNLAIYVLVFALIKQIQRELIEVRDFAMLSTIFVISLALLPVVFNPLNYAARGNWSTFDSLLAIWPYQMLANGLCLALNFFIFTKRVKQ